MKKTLINTLISVIITVAIVTAGMFVINGIPLFGVPDAEEVVSVEIVNVRLGGETRVFTDQEHINLAVKMANFVPYGLGKSDQTESLIQITYHLENGDSKTLGASNTTVYWNGKAHPIKEKSQEMFITLSEGIFFFDLVAQE